jgi:GNAT superfamily N-acetyltransferase
MADRLRSSPYAALAADLRCVARRHGPRAALDLVGRTLAASVQAEDLLVLVKPLDSIAPIAFSPRLHVEDLDTASLAALDGLGRRTCMTRANARSAANLARRYHGFTAAEAGELVGYYWWQDRAAEPHPHLARLGVELGPADVYGFDFFLAEDHRGDGRAVEFLYAVETTLRARGYDRLWGYVAARNTPARWLYASRGYETVRTLHLRPGSMR